MFPNRFNDGSWLGGGRANPRRVGRKARAEAGRFATAQDALYSIRAISAKHPDRFSGSCWAVTNERGGRC
jgi:hypothetical protein